MFSLLTALKMFAGVAALRSRVAAIGGTLGTIALTSSVAFVAGWLYASAQCHNSAEIARLRADVVAREAVIDQLNIAAREEAGAASKAAEAHRHNEEELEAARAQLRDLESGDCIGRTYLDRLRRLK